MPRGRVDAIAVALAHALACAIVLATGFDHVSDDDFARTTIAQAFAHAPRLDPSGTSWLPFPFWWMGVAMAIFGRTIAVARVASIALASAATAVFYVALRRSFGGAPGSRGRALAGVAFAILSPWPLWLGASTVPESFAASATAAGAIALAARPSPAFAALLCAACLSRYEPWPAAAVVGATLAVAAVRTRGRVALACASLAAAGPLAWMAWNAATHGSPVHFFHRVSTFKRAIGEGSTDTFAALVFYPKLLATMRPELVLACLAGVPALRDPSFRRRWQVPLGCALAIVAFLAIGNARDGAPAHHPERALLGVTFLLAPFAVDACAELAAKLRAAAAVGVLVVWAWSARTTLAEPPGASASEDRRPQIARGSDLRARGVDALTIQPCAFEHFALVAAYGAPEKVTTLPRTGAAVTPDCPRVVEHAGRDHP